MAERGRRVVGLALYAAGDAAYATALLLAPLWLAHLAFPGAGYGSGLAVGPAVVVLALAVSQPAGRALLMLAGLTVALTVCALAWPLPDWTWLAAFAVGAVLSAGVRELTRVRTFGFGGLAIVVGLVGLLLARRVLALDDAGSVSVQFTLALLVVWLPMWLTWQAFRWAFRPPPPPREGTDRDGVGVPW